MSKITATETFGQEPSVPTKQCPKCEGAGYIRAYARTVGNDELNFRHDECCPRCNGAGKVVCT